MEHRPQHLLVMTNNSLDLSKVEAGKVDTYIEQFDLPDFLLDLDSYR